MFILTGLDPVYGSRIVMHPFKEGYVKYFSPGLYRPTSAAMYVTKSGRPRLKNFQFPTVANTIHLDLKKRKKLKLKYRNFTTTRPTVLVVVV